MKWKAWYRGVVIIPENDTDKELLVKLKELLPKEAEESYESGKMYFEDDKLKLDC